MRDASRYTKSADGGLIDICTVDPGNRYARGPYRCLSCGHLMVPALGRTRKHHFKHKAGRPGNCVDETYLHQLGKLTLFNALSDAIKNKKRFPLTRPQSIICDRNAAEFGITCTSRTHIFVDNLARRFDSIEMEKGVAGFIADLLLTSSDTDDKLLLEIVVTHQSEQEKISSGLSIVEIEIKNEDDIETLKVGIDTTSANVKCYNLPALEGVPQRCIDPCDMPCVLFLLYDSGKAWFSRTSSRSVAELTSDPRLITWEIVDAQNSDGVRDQLPLLDPFKRFIVDQRFQHHRDVRSCMLCQYNGGQRNAHDIHCNDRDRSVWMSSSACGCPSYLPATDAEEAMLLLDNNLKTLP
jgi:hypothetical protein